MALPCILCICLRKNYCCFLTPLQVSQQFAECISLPDHTTVQVRAISNVAKATLVTIEPHSEDDWEVLELNSEHAEAAILNQVHFFCYVNLLFQFPCCPIKSAQLFCCVQPFITCVCSSIYFLIGKFHMHSVDLEPTSPRPHHSSHYPGRKYQLSYNSLEFVCVLILFLIYFYFHKGVFQGICSYRLLYPYWSSIISHCLLY